MTNLPDGAHLAYTVYHDTDWWRASCKHDRPNDGRRTVMVAASSDDGGCAWEFSIEEYQFRDRTTAVRIAVFGDACPAFTQIPEFFTALAQSELKSLDQVVELLTSLGAVDRTERPGGQR